MTTESFVRECGFDIVCMPCPEKEVRGAYVGDLLSWVMGRAESGNAWITIMTNINTVAVASLADISCILLAEGVAPDMDALNAAQAKGVNIVSSKLSAFDLANRISVLVK